jgi:repressor LexA
MDRTLANQGINSQKEIYEFIIDFITENKYSPTVREICDGTSLKSTSSVYYHLMELQKIGKIEMKQRQTRTIKIVGYSFVKDGE